MDSSRVRNLKQGIALFSISLIFSFLAFEVILRFFITPSQLSYGKLFGHELPPIRVIPPVPPEEISRSKQLGDILVDGKYVTVGDLYGAYKEDPLTGFVPLEKWTSTNQCWINNNFGARAEEDVMRSKRQNQMRILVFGDSFAVGNGLCQQDVWSSLLQMQNQDMEFLNFGVPGYGMGQSLLRYQQIRSELEYDVAVLIFVPEADLWRDVNVLRDLGEEGWFLYNVMPRFVINQNQLVLISSPYENTNDVYKDNAGQISDNLREHLLAYDRFYYPAKYEETGPFDRSIIYKMIIKYYYDTRRRNMHKMLMDPDSESLQLSRAFFDKMNSWVKNDGGNFVLVFLPTHQDLQLLAFSDSYKHKWNLMIESTCNGAYTCIDLASDLMQATPKYLDTSYDGTHYGPFANRLIATLVQRTLEEMLLP